MNKKEFTIGKLFFWIIVIAGFAIRFIGLAKIPLSEIEASIANQALNGYFKDNLVSIPPILIAVLGLLFSLFKSSAFWARFSPALLGSLVPLFPIFYKEKIGERTAIIAAILLAFDPISIAASRTLESPIVAIFIALLTITLIHKRQLNWAAISFGLYLLCGSDAVFGGIIFIFYFGIRYLFNRQNQQAVLEVDRKQLLNFILISSITFLLISSQFFTSIDGISYAFSQLFFWFAKIGTLQKISLTRILSSMIIYIPLLLLFGGIGAVRVVRSKNTIGKQLSVFSMASLLIVILYPGRHVFDLLWMILPLSVIASIEISTLFDQKFELPSVLLSIGMILFGFFLAFNMFALARNNYTFGSNEFILQIAIIFIVIILMVLSVLMIRAGWSQDASRKGWTLAALFLLTIYAFAIGWQGTHNLAHHKSELWHQGYVANEVNLLVDTLELTSKRAIGTKDGVSIELYIQSQSLIWETRNFKESNLQNIKFNITDTDDEMTSFEEDGYRGQSFLIQSNPIFKGQSIDVLLDWFVYREIPTSNQEIVLWVPNSILE